jgi:hypothetical protein
MEVCHLCEFKTIDETKMNAHRFQQPGIIKCDRCEYGAEDSDIMKKHKMNHSGTIIFICNTCEFEATKQSLLEAHKEPKHTSAKKREVFSYPFLMENHGCSPVFKYPCEMCTFVFIGFSEPLEHMDLVHTNALASCSKCDYKTKNQNDLDVHIIDNHSEPGPIEREQYEENLSQKLKLSVINVTLLQQVYQSL